MADKNEIKSSTIAQAKYDATHCVRISLKLNIVTDAPILSKLSSEPSMSRYIRTLVMKDISTNDPQHLQIKVYQKPSKKMSLGHKTPTKEDLE